MERHDDSAAWQVRLLLLRRQDEIAVAFTDVLQRDGARAALAWLDRWYLGEFDRAPDEHLWDLAYIHARLGNREAALQFLQRGYDRRDVGMLQARVDPDLVSLRGDPRFDDLLQRIGPD
jgi:hypothetical protein